MRGSRFVIAFLLLTEIICIVKSQLCQSCDQQVTGRNFNYGAALDIIQNEGYLDEADVDDIRIRRHYHKHLKKRRKKRDLEFITAFKNSYPIFGTQFFTEFGFNRKMNTRSELDTELAAFTSTQRSQFCEYITNNGVNINLANFVCHDPAAGEYPRTFPNLNG